MSCLICNKVLHHMCELCNISKPFHLHGKGFSHIMYLWINHMCISLNHTLVHLGCHSITKTKQGPFNLSLFGNWCNSTKIWKLSSFQASTSHKCKLLTWFGFYATYPTFKLYVKIWISTIKPNLVVKTPPTCVLKWFGCLNTCINMKFVGVLPLLSDAKVYRITFEAWYQSELHF